MSPLFAGVVSRVHPGTPPQALSQPLRVLVAHPQLESPTQLMGGPVTAPLRGQLQSPALNLGTHR